MPALTQFAHAPGSAAWYRQVEQELVQAKAEIRRLWTEIQRLRNQVGNLPSSPDVVPPS